MDKNYRVHTNIISDTVLNVNLRQDIDFLEVLTMKIGQVDAYKLHSSNYGVIVGRVLANDAFGIPNAKVSVFIPSDGNDSVSIENIYPFTSTQSYDSDWTRYNLLPDYSDNECYRVVGKFPRKRYLLDDDTMIEVYDKYWKYTTVTNSCGDYMIFGVPSGTQTIHVDVDMSDIGVLSQKPSDFMNKGYAESSFDSQMQFKEDKNLSSLVQIFSQDNSVTVYPFWGDDDIDVISITRCDVQINYKFETTCVFMGAIVSDNGNNSIGHKCEPSKKSGMSNQLIAGNGTIEMIRKTTDGLTEEYPINGNQLIDGDGVWCYQIPMNLDYVGMDEYGNIVPTNNVNKGIATRTRVRFRISKSETGEEGLSRHTAKYLVPMNPMYDENEVVPKTVDDGPNIEAMYNFGSSTPDDCFRDLYWNNVYSVKNFIPKVQTARRPNSPKYNAVKSVNIPEDKNGAPFNKIRIDIPIAFMIVCILFEIVMFIIEIVNSVIYALMSVKYFKLPLIGRVFKKIIPGIPCIPFGAGLEDEDDVWYPGCKCPGSDACKNTPCPDGFDSDCNKKGGGAELRDKMQQKLAMEYNIVRLDFFQDWMNGCLYMPQWYWRKRKKKTFLFGLFTIRGAKNEFCDCDNNYKKLKTYVSCEPKYNDTSLGLDKDSVPDGEDKWHQSKNRSTRVWFRKGLIKTVENKDGLTVYYYAAIQPTTENKKVSAAVGEFKEPFYGIRLYATDIILLGNLSENNIYGIPQFYKCLEPSTANVPEIASVVDEATDDDSDSEKASGDDEDNLPLTITGMDWGNKGKNTTPKYGRGLFIDISCTWAHTKAKSCFNVERLSELGVGLDMSHNMQYSDGANIMSGLFEPDGFISKYEIYDNENRAMFATMNHVGFVPQEYHEKHLENTHPTQHVDDRTGYYIPLFKFMYPTDFDGRQNEPMKMYKKKFAQDMIDLRDQTYVDYRMGDGHHFYKNDGGSYGMPLYNNSFYFWFGINIGKTAIDKFNKKFNGICTQRVKSPFTMITSSNGLSYCPDAYTNVQDAYPYIFIDLDDIEAPFSYTLYAQDGSIVVSEQGLEDKGGIVIGGYLDSNGTPVANSDGLIHLTDGTVTDKRLSNQTYSVIVSDANGMGIRERVIVSMPKISLEFDTSPLGTRYYNDVETPREMICDPYREYYGVMSINSFTVDGYVCEITNITSISIDEETGVLSFYLMGRSDVSDNVSATVEIQQVYADGVGMEYCLCQVNSTVVDAVNNRIYFYYPSTYSVKITQMCDDELSKDNFSTQNMTIENGDALEMFLNDMPVRFMIEEDPTVADAYLDGNFYANNPTNVADANGLKGWLRVHDESTYLFNLIPISDGYSDFWSRYSDINDIKTIESRKELVASKLNMIFSLSLGTYVGNDTENSFIVDASGGKPPILFKSIVPMYDAEETSDVAVYHVYEDGNLATLSVPFPNIVGNNYAPYMQTWDYKPVVNSTRNGRTLFYNSNFVGNYFAVYSKDGGYQPDGTVDPSVYVERLPNLATLNVGNLNKKKGDTVYYGIEPKFRNVYQQIAGVSNPFVRAMFVDRAHDFDFVVIGNFDVAADSIVRRPRLSGFTYNGIEMAYDDSYNIISANESGDTEGNVLKYTSNNDLEYSYEISEFVDDDAHEFVARSVYNKDTVDRKRLYQATLNGFDIRDMYWYKGYPVTRPDEVVDYYPIDHGEDFKDVTNGNYDIDNYPTKRLLDICNIANGEAVRYTARSCSYEMTAGISSQGVLNVKTKPLDDISFNVRLSGLITFDVTDQGDEEETGAHPKNNLLENPNVVFVKNGSTYTKPSNVYLRCKYKNVKADGFEIYPRSPIVVPVNNVDWMRSLKSDPNVDVSAVIGSVSGYDFMTGFALLPRNYWLPDDVSKVAPSSAYIRRDGKPCSGNYGSFFKRGSEYLPLSEADDLAFGLHTVDTDKLGSSVSRFVLLTDSEYVYSEDPVRMRCIRVIDTTSVYDINSVTVTGGVESNGSYEFAVSSSSNTQFSNEDAAERLMFVCRAKSGDDYYYSNAVSSWDQAGNCLRVSGSLGTPTGSFEYALFAVTDNGFVYKFGL